MWGHLIHRGRQPQYLDRIAPGRGRDVDDDGASHGQCAGLVHHQSCCAAQLFQRASVADHHTMTRGPRQAGHDRHRCGQQQRARSRHHQHRHRPHRRPAGQPRPARHQQRQRQEPRRIAVGQPYHGRVLRPGLRGQSHDLRVRAVGGGGGGVHLECAARVDHPAAHRFADAALHLQRLAGQDRLVQHRHRTGNAPVYGHHLAWADDQQIVDPHLIQRDHPHRRPDAAAGEPRRMFEQRP